MAKCQTLKAEANVHGFCFVLFSVGQGKKRIKISTQGREKEEGSLMFEK